MTLHQLKIFAAVAKVGSFTQVAKNLRLSQPSVSLLIQSLQRELGVKLFERLGNKVHLTEAGRRLLQLVDSTLAIIEKIPEEMDEVKGLRKGRIRVGGSGISAAFLPLVIEAFKKGHPSIEVSLKIDDSRNLENQLLEGNIDLAIISYPPHSRLLVGELFREEEVVAIASPKHPLAKKRSVPFELLANEPLVMFEKGGLVYDMVERRFAESGASFKPSLEVKALSSARDAVKGAVAGGLGIGFIAKRHVMGDIKTKRLKVLKVPDLNLKRSVYIVLHQKRNGSRLVETFRDFLKHYKEKR